MGTRSIIALDLSTPKPLKVGYRAAYCHWDGYVEDPGVGHVLQNHYTGVNKIKRLLALGEMSSLGTDIGEKHEFEQRAEDDATTTYYTRDRGDDWELCKPKDFIVLPEVLCYADEMGTEYIYIFSRGTKIWEVAFRSSQAFGCSDGTPFSKFIPLKEAIKLREKQIAADEQAENALKGVRDKDEEDKQDTVGTAFASDRWHSI